MNQQRLLIRWESIHSVPRERSASYSYGLANRSRGLDIPSVGSKIGRPSNSQAQNHLQSAIWAKSTVID